MKNVSIILLALLWCVESFASEYDLTQTMLSLDTQLFAAFNKCDDEEQLALHESFFDADIEFYHDNGGVTWDRETMIDNTKSMRAAISLESLSARHSRHTQSKTLGQ